jgi:inner membrane protein
MDNLAHSLVGAALGAVGLRHKTGLGMATLILAANLPDIDAFGIFFGHNLAWRRGWTHGPIALALLPPLLAAVMLAFDRWQAHRGTRPPSRRPARFGWLVALAYIAALSHPLLDFLNTYGIRWLMPFSDRWFYGDALFIIDVWLWLALAVSLWLSRRRLGGTPAAAALAATALYAGAMGAGSLAAERMTVRELARRGHPAPAEVVASPVPLNPFRRDIVYSFGHSYGFGRASWRPGLELELEPGLVPTNMADPAIAAAAARNKEMADFLYWSRLPFATVERRRGEARVTIGDARYNSNPAEGPFSVSVSVPE